jgi:metal-dependent amidase/aminoacylase/carboxypeptidase family protein
VRSAVDPLQPVVVSMGKLSGSGAPNVLPDEARAAGTVRTMRPQDMAALHARIEALVTGIAEGHGCEGRYLVRRGEPPLLNDAPTAAAAADWLATLGLPTASFASCGSDDFATYGEVLPILMMFVGTGTGPGTPTLHDAQFLPPDGAVREVALALLAGWLAGVETHLPRRGAAGEDGVVPEGVAARS